MLNRAAPPTKPHRPAPTCVPCVEGRQRAAPHSSTFPPTEAPLETLHIDVWGPTRVRGQGHEPRVRSLSLVAESASASDCPPSVGGECALGTDVLEDGQQEFECFAATVLHLVSMLLAPEGDPDEPDIPTPCSYAEAIEGPYSSQWQAAMDAEMASYKSTGTYVDEVPPPGVNIVSGMWIFRGVDFFQTFSPTPKMTTLQVLLHVAAQRDYELHSLDFSTAFLQGSLHEEILLRRPPGLTGSFPAGTQWSLRRPVYGLRQAPCEWRDTLRTTLAVLGFDPSTSDPSLFICSDTILPPFYILVYVDDLVFAIADTEALAHVKSELQKRHMCTDLGPSALRLHVLLAIVHSSAYSTSGMGLVLGGRARVVLTGHADASWVDDLATQRSSQGYTFSLGSGSVSWRSTRSSSVLSSSCEAEIYAGAMAAQELRWLTYLLTDLGEAPHSPPVLYVDNKAMLGDGKGIVHDLTCPYTPQQNGMAEREMRTMVESVRTMLLHMGVQHHWWHLALRQAVWVRNCLERSTVPPGTTPYQLLTGQKPDLSMARVWGCMAQFLVPEQQRGGKLKRKARWGRRELCVGPRPRLGGADFVVGCTGGTANLQQWATPTWASWSLISKSAPTCKVADLGGRRLQEVGPEVGADLVTPTSGSRLGWSADDCAGRRGAGRMEVVVDLEVDGHIQEHLVDVVTWDGEAGSCTVPNVHVGDTKVMDTLEGRLEDARRRHEAQEYGVIPWAVIEAGLRSVWAAEHPPSRPASPRPVTNEGGVDVGVHAGGDQVGSSAGGMSMQRGVIHADEVGGVQTQGMRPTAVAGTSLGDVTGRRSGLSSMLATQVTAGGIAPSYGYFKFTPDRILVTSPLVGRPDILTWKEAIEPQLEMAGLIGFARGTVATPEEHHADLRAEFRAVQLLTFTVISRCCSPGVQIALKWCREYLDAGHRAWHFIESTYQVTDDLFIAQLEGQLTHLCMGDEETATDYCNRARRILATIGMAGAQYSTASYVTHVMQGISSSYNLLKRLSMSPSTRTTLNEDNLTSYILQDEAMQEAERSQELLAQANFIAPAKQGGLLGQRGQSGGGGSSGWNSTKEVDKKKPTKDSGRGGGGRRRECWLCGDPDHLSFECPDRSDSNDDDTKGGHGRSGSRRPRRGGNQPRKEKQSTTSTSAKDADSSAGGKARDDKAASCSLVGVVESTVSLVPEAGEDFQAVAAAVQANPAVVLLDSGCSHHLMGTKEVFVDLQPSGPIKHVRGFNGALQDV
ncbi:unnamed protein product [Closterium sp. NIES-53]